MARDYLLWFPANTGLTRRQGRIHQSTNACSVSQIEANNEIDDWLQHRSLWWGVIKPLFPCFLLWYLNPRGCGCNSFLLRVTNGWLWSLEEEGALSQRQERTGDLYRGVGTRGRILGNFTALASPSAVPLAGATEGLNYPVQIWHGYYYVGCWEYTSPSESVDREISSEASGENGMQAVSQKPGTGK